MKTQINIKRDIKICAFCKYWYDPTNEAIAPKNPSMGSWEYDRDAKNPCLKEANARNLRNAYSKACSNYECKIPD